MTNSVGFRPKLLPPRGRQLEQSYRPLVTCLMVSGCITVLVGVVFGLTGFNIYSHRFGRSEHKYHAGDEMSLRQASSDLSPTFCSAYTVQPMGRVNFYLFPRQAELSPSETVPISFTLTAIPRRRFVSSTHYLLVNSTVRLSACYRDNSGSTSDPLAREREHSPAMILVVVGDDHFQEWLKHYNMRHVRHSVPVPRNATCGDPSSVPTLPLTVAGSNNYHFVLMSHTLSVARHHDEEGGARTHHLPMGSMRHAPIDSPAAVAPPLLAGNATTLVLAGSVNRTQFNLTAAETVCNASESSCSFPLQWGSHPDVVAKIRQDAEIPDNPASFVTRCQERWEFWIPVFGGLPAVIMVSMWVWCWYLLVKRRNVRSRYSVREPSSVPPANYGSIGEEREPLMAGVPPPEHERVVSESDERCATIQG